MTAYEVEKQDRELAEEAARNICDAWDITKDRDGGFDPLTAKERTIKIILNAIRNSRTLG
jgi:hypothetical protein